MTWVAETVHFIAVCAFSVGIALIVYHHLIYPALLQLLAMRARSRGVTARSAETVYSEHVPPEALPRIGVLVPAFNEAAHIGAKIKNLAALDYPRAQLQITVVLDGCTDTTAEEARKAVAQLSDDVAIQLVDHAINRGKVAVVNEFIGRASADVLVLTDASAMLPADALWRLAHHFCDPKVVMVTGRYCVDAQDRSADYWRYQGTIKADEAALGAPMGAHGACYAVRKDRLRALPSDTINDDFVLPMRAVLAGGHGIYDDALRIVEAETTTSATVDWRRRSRLGAGNLQQAIWLTRPAMRAPAGMAFCFFSGKWLRGLMPFILAATFLCGLIALQPALFAIASTAREGTVFVGMLALGCVSIVLGACTSGGRRVVRAAHYAGVSYTAMLCGASDYLVAGVAGPWLPARLGAAAQPQTDYIPRSVRISKRVLDLVCAAAVLFVLTLVFIPIAIAIKLESPGPIFYRQMRVGRQTPSETEIFWLIKFRSMYTDAEKRSGAVWASQNDPRITRVGNFLRKTRLDELPQAFNIFRGEMSIIGPRPERPVFFNDLEEAIPFYTERTYGLRPGVTGLAQVSTGYDASVEDVRTKVLYDHVYAARLTSWWRWLQSDLEIIFQTVKVMALKKGV